MEFSWMLLIAALVGLLWVLKPWQMFAGGTETDLTGAYPTGANSLLSVVTNPVSMTASQTGTIFHQMEIPFKCKVMRAEVVGIVALTPTIYVYDDSSTAKEVIGVAATYQPLVAKATVLRQGVTVDSTKILFAGSILTFKFTTVASESTTGATLRLWLSPVG